MPSKIIYTPPPDKSITIRCLVIASLVGKKINIKNPLYCSDTLYTIKNLEKLGCCVRKNKSSITIKGPGLYGYRKNIVIDVGESALFLRLILAVLLNQNSRYIIKGRKTILRRDFSDTLIPLIKLGAKIKHNNYHLPFKIYPSNLKNESFKTTSAQTKSMLMMLSLYKKGIKIKEDKKTRDHTENIMRYMGVEIKEKNCWIEIEGNLKKRNLEVCGDFSSAAPFIVISVIKKLSIKIKNCIINTKRIGLLRLIENMGVEVIFKNTKEVMNEKVSDIIINPPQILKSAVVKDITDMIDEFMLAAILLSYALGKSTLYVEKTLSNKESDRILLTIEILKKMNTFKKYDSKKIEIVGGNPQKIKFIDTHSDHRAAMAGGVLKIINNPSIKISDTKCVSKTYPNFWKDIKRYFC